MEVRTIRKRKGQVGIAIAALSAAVLVVAGGVAVSMGVGPFNSASPDDTDTSPSDSGTEMVNYNEFKSLVDVSVPNGTYDVVFIPSDVEAGNYGSADVTKVGADSDEEDTQELFKSEDVEKGEDYYVASDGGFGTEPPAGSYKYAVIGSDTANVYGDAQIADENGMVKKLRTEQDAPLEPLEGVDIYDYASGVTADTTKVVDDGDAIALDADYTDDVSDSEVDGTVTGVKTWTVDGTDTVAQFGEVSVSNVNSSVDTITVDLLVDGEEVMSVSDSDFSDGSGLDDGVSVEDETEQMFANAEEEVTVETEIEFDDASMDSGTLAKTTLDDTDDDSSLADGSYGFSAVSQTWTGY